MMKKSLSLILILIMALAFGVCAEDVATTETADNTAKVVLSATEPDENGYFTATLTVYNAEFFGIQADIAYNKEAIVPVSWETQEETDDFSEFAYIKTIATDLETEEEIEDWCSTIGNSIDTEKGQFAFTVYLMPAQIEKANSIVNEEGRMVADAEEGLAIYEFLFKKISDKDAGLKLGTHPANPDGLILADYNFKHSYTFDVELPEALSKEKVETVTYTYTAPVIVSDDSEDSKVPMEQRVKARSRNAIFLNIGNYATVSDSKLKWIDKDNKEVKPYIKDDRTMVPLRFLAEEMGATVGYNEETAGITITLGETVMELIVGEKAYTLNGEAKEMDCAAEILKNRTFVPVRFVSEALGKAVEWLANERMVVVTNTNYPWAKDNGVEKALLSEIQLMVSPLIRDLAN